MAPLTSFGLGGPADVLARPDSEIALAELLALAVEEGFDYYVLGGGSNVLFPDQGYRGLVIKLGEAFNWVSGRKDGRLSAGATCPSARVLAEAAALGLSGLEGLSGLPGHIGGALKMNAGLKGWETGAKVEKLVWLNGRGQIEIAAAPELEFGYRNLVSLPRGAVIVKAFWRLEPEEPAAVQARAAELLNRRKLTQPQGWPSAGCVFKNPAGDSAGRIIEAAGLKGASCGGAWISPVHANFIVARRGARASEVRALIDMVKNRIQDEFGLSLALEIETPGWDDPAPRKSGAPNE